MTWIEKLLNATEEAETPRSYIYWAGISAIAAVVSPNVYINRQGVYKLSPNLFVMLIGESGLGKGLPIFLAKQLVSLAGTTRIIQGRNTIASIIQDLATTESDEETGKPKFKDARGFVVSGEFSTLLQRDEQALSVLTEMYDTHYMGSWADRTKHSGKSKLENLNLTLLGGSTPEHFKNVVPDTDVKGGFVGRILTVYEEDRYRVNPLSDTEAENQLLKTIPDLAEWLKTIALVKGPFSYTKQSLQRWNDWYVDIRTRKIHDPTGAVNRLPDNVLKVAMCVALSRDVDLKIELDDLEEAIERCMQLTVDSRRLVGGKGNSPLGEGAHAIIQMLFRAECHQLYKKHILQRNYGQFDLFELNRILDTLEAADFIHIKDTKEGALVIMPEHIVVKLHSLMERDK